MQSWDLKGLEVGAHQPEILSSEGDGVRAAAGHLFEFGPQERHTKAAERRS